MAPAPTRTPSLHFRLQVRPPPSGKRLPWRPTAHGPGLDNTSEGRAAQIACWEVQGPHATAMHHQVNLSLAGRGGRKRSPTGASS
eukprot:115103-Pyramimonas_sp.AAC.1